MTSHLHLSAPPASPACWLRPWGRASPAAVTLTNPPGFDLTSPAIGSSVVAAGNIVGAVANSAHALSALDGNPRIDVAFDQAQSCQQLRTVQLPGR